MSSLEYTESKSRMFIRFAEFLARVPKTPYTGAKQKKKSLFGSKQRPSFSFTCQDVLEFVKTLAPEGRPPTEEEVYKPLRAYIKAHLLHCPHKRALTNVTSLSTVLQPTPKGLSILQSWFYIHAQELSDEEKSHVVSMLCSPHNTLDLVYLERDGTGELEISSGVCMIIWRHLVGNEPQIYQQEDGVVIPPSPLKVINPNIISIADPSNREPVISPYHTDLPTHPNSQNVCQYWTSNGIRFFQNLRFAIPPKHKLSAIKEFEIQYVLSGHALFQWVCDCTSVQTPKEAQRIVRNLIRNKFLRKIQEPVVDVVSATTYETKVPLEISSSTLFRLTPRGSRICPWESVVEEEMLDPRDVLINKMDIANKFNRRAAGQSDDEYYDGDFEEEFCFETRSTYTESTKYSRQKSISGKSHASKRSSVASINWRWENILVPKPDQEDLFSKAATIENIISDPGLRYLFRKYVEGMYCSEIFRFYCSSLPSLVHVAKELYLRDGAPLELNISESLKTKALNSAANSLELVESLRQIHEQCGMMTFDLLGAFAQWPGIRDVYGFNLYCIDKYVKELV